MTRINIFPLFVGNFKSFRVVARNILIPFVNFSFSTSNFSDFKWLLCKFPLFLRRIRIQSTNKMAMIISKHQKMIERHMRISRNFTAQTSISCLSKVHSCQFEFIAFWGCKTACESFKFYFVSNYRNDRQAGRQWPFKIQYQSMDKWKLFSGMDKVFVRFQWFWSFVEI